jgi:hypothetical protein
MAVECYVTLTCQYHKEGRRWVGICRELGTSTYNRSLSELQKQLAELVTLHLNCLEELGERERFFKENKIKIYPVKPKFVTEPIPEKSDVFIRPSVHRLPVLASSCGN